MGKPKAQSSFKTEFSGAVLYVLLENHTEYPLTGTMPKNWKKPDVHSFFQLKHCMKNYKLVIKPIREPFR